MTKRIKTKTFLEAGISNLPRSLEPALTSWLFRQGCWGTQELLDFSQSNLRYPPRIKQKKFINVSAYFDPLAKESLEIDLDRWISEHSPGSELKWMIQKNQDWLREWKKHFAVFKLCGLNFVPSWLLKKKHKLASTVIVEPGMAFGTGTHATTRFAIEILQKLSLLDPKFSKSSMLDVGAGSGILSVVAERFGVKHVDSIDNDSESWRECKKMFKLNQSKKCFVTETQVEKIKQKYEITVANIIDGVLISLKKSLWRCTKKGGYIILSGILTDGATAFLKSFLENQKAEVLVQVGDDEWTAFLIKKL
jgi:ribosomal protein L11 methyltransferase